MSRQKRQLSQSGLYHIIFRGIGRQNIFEEDADYQKLKTIIKKVKSEMNFELYFKSGISKSALERATGISRGTIIRICKEM